MMVYVAVAVLAYLLGSIPFGYILVRVFLKSDIRQTGSGNIGATNVGRTGHKGLAIATLLLDAGKGAAAVMMARFLFDWADARSLTMFYGLPGIALRERYLFAAVAALFVVLGHVFPVWLKFQGGKGVAAAVGAFALLAPKAVVVALAVFLVVVAATRIVSLGSILGAAAFPMAVHFLPPRMGDYRLDSPGLLVMVSLTSALVILKHHQNIRRLLAGTENKLGAKPKPPANSLPVEKRA